MVALAWGVPENDTACAGRHTLYLTSDASVVESGIEPSGLVASLRGPLEDIDYCIRPLESGALPLPDSQQTQSFLMTISARPAGGDCDSGLCTEVVVALVRAREASVEAIQAARQRPLAVVPWLAHDPQTSRDVFSRKVVENLRASYLCHLSIESEPAAAEVSASSGLEGTTPVEWIVPVGPLTLEAAAEGYRGFSKELDLSRPGRHNVYLQLERRRFYHSRLMIPTVAFGVAAGVFYGLDRYYYERYRSLGEDDYWNRPGAFGTTFERAKLMERLAGVCAGLAGVSLVLSFRL